jgi:hypothetical protein
MSWQLRRRYVTAHKQAAIEGLGGCYFLPTRGGIYSHGGDAYLCLVSTLTCLELVKFGLISPPFFPGTDKRMSGTTRKGFRNTLVCYHV